MYTGSGFLDAGAQVPPKGGGQAPRTDPESRARLRAVYLAEIGVVEASGRNDGSRIAAYLQYCGLGEGYAWCAAFVCWAYGQAGIANPRTAWAAALFPEDRLVYQRGRTGPGGTPQQGDVFGIYFANLGRIAHVGFVDEWGEGSYFITVEGNTDQAGSRNGDGVYRKRRPKSQAYKVAAFVNPKTLDNEEY